MIKSKEAVQLLVFLIINCHTRQGVMVMGASTYYKQSGQEMGEQQQKHQPQQQVANVELSYASQNNQENPKRYIMQDLELKGVPRSPGEQYRLIKLNNLLDSLSIPTRAPPVSAIYRTGRTYPSTGSISDYVSNSLSSSLRGQQQVPQAIRSVIPSNTNTKHSQKGTLKVNDVDLSNSKAGRQLQYVTWYPAYERRLIKMPSDSPHPLGSDEIPLHTPMDPRSMNDFDFKRVENTRWNNLRGMWGKRASSGSGISSNMDEQQQQDGDEDRAADSLMAALIGDGGQQQIIGAKTM